jgi:hypothetical protein
VAKVGMSNSDRTISLRLQRVVKKHNVLLHNVHNQLLSHCYIYYVRVCFHFHISFYYNFYLFPHSRVNPPSSTTPLTFPSTMHNYKISQL